MNQNCMITREAALEFGLSFQNTYTERPFRDQNWQVVRARENKKIFKEIFCLYGCGTCCYDGIHSLFK